METTIVVVAYNSADVLPGCLDALPAASEGIGPLRVVVVDNDSRDDTAAVARQHPQVWRVLPMGRNAGYA
ncbi:MAG TPA: glycosyltransferase, partial [Egibacteraceae bacterium]